MHKNNTDPIQKRYCPRTKLILTGAKAIPSDNKWCPWTQIDLSHKYHNAPVYMPQYTMQKWNVDILVLNLGYGARALRVCEIWSILTKIKNDSYTHRTLLYWVSCHLNNEIVITGAAPSAAALLFTPDCSISRIQVVVAIYSRWPLTVDLASEFPEREM